jgi:hypothetical protein
MNAKHPFWNSVVSKPEGAKLLDLLYTNQFEISAPKCPTDYFPAGNGDVIDIAVYKNARMSEVTVSDIMDSDHLPIIFQLLDRIRTKNLSDLVGKFTDWKWFQSLVYELISPIIQINWGGGGRANKVVRDVTDFVSSA